MTKQEYETMTMQLLDKSIPMEHRIHVAMHLCLTGGKEGKKVMEAILEAAARANGEALFEEKLKLAAAAFRPDFLLISAGFDAAAGDTLGRMRLTPQGYASLTRLVKGIAAQHCHGRLVSVLEGGYNRDSLAASVAAHVRTLME